MQTLIFLSFLSLVAAQETGTCVVDGAEAVSDALDGSMYIWAAISRCGKDGEMVKCEIAVSSAITSVNSMINVILAAVDKCGALNTVNKECGLEMAKLTKHAGGITSAAGGIAQKCFKGPAHGLNWNHAGAAMCVVNIKDTAKSFFKIVKSFLKLEKGGSCSNGDSNACAANALQIIGAFSGFGEYVAGSIGKCSASGSHKGTLCAQQSEKLVQHLTTFAESGIDVAKACKTSESAARLYNVNTKQIGAGEGTSSANLLLAAFLPITAIVGFVGGRIYGGRRSTRGTREIAPMTDLEE